MEASQDDLLQQLRELCVSEQEAKAKVEEHEAQIQELQNTITELHQEMSLKDQDKLEQLQQLVQLEARVKELTQEVESDQPPARGIELLKTELSQRDSTIQKLRRDLLHSHQARDCQSAQLDFQEQRLWELQRELQEKQWELQRGHGRLQQLSTELQSTVRHSQELQSQLCEVRGQLVQVKGENEALLGCKRLQAAEVERLGAEVGTIQRANEEVQETQRRCRELEAELLVIKTQLSNSQNSTQDAQKKADEQIKQLQEEVARLDNQYSSVTHQLQERTSELQSLQKTHSELLVRDRECQRELSQTREELHTATLRAEEQHLKEVQIDELQQEVDRMLALLDKEREDGSQLEELQRLREDQQWLKDKLDERDRKVAALNLEVESLRDQVCTRDRDAADLCTQLITSQGALQQATVKLRSHQRELKEQETLSAGLEQSVVDLKAELTQIQHQYTTCYSQLVVEEASVSKLRTELQEVEGQRDELESQLENQQSQLHLLTEKHRTAQQEVSSRDDTILKLTAELSTAQEHLISTQKELAEKDLEMKSNVDEVVALEKKERRLQELLRQKEEQLEDIKHKFDILQLEKETLLTQCDSQRVAVRELSAEVKYWQQEARDQRESREEEDQKLRRELQEVQAHLQQQKFNQDHLHRELETAHKQQRDAEEEALHKEAALRSQDSELNRLKAEHLEAQRAASETEAMLQHLTESTDLYKHKYQACLNKIAELESTLHCQDEDLKEARAKVLEREEQVLRLQAEAVVLRDDVKARCAQLDSGDDALATLGQRLRDTQRELELSHAHAQECELVINTLRDNMAIMRRQIEEKEEAMVKVQSDFSVYRATHVHSDSYYESQLSHIHELEQTLSQTLGRCGEGARELSACQLELEKLKEDVWKQRQLKDASLAEVQRLQELLKQLQADAVHVAQSRQAELDTLEHRATGLAEQLEAARRQYEQKEQAVQKRDMLLRQSEADLVQARDKIRSKALESERHVQTLQADLRQAKKEKRERENECAMLRTQLLQLRGELKEAQASCRDSAQELARHEEKVLLLEGGQQRAQEQLAERVAEVVRAEQTQRRLQAELREIQQRLETTQEDLHECRTLLEQAKKDADNSRQAQLSTQQEAAHLQQEKHWLQEELTSTKQSLTHLQEQLNECSTTIQALRLELAQDQLRKKEQLNWAQGARNRESSLETERDQLRKELETARNQLSERERRVNALQERVHELQSATIRQQEELTDSQGQLQQSMRHLQDRDMHMKKLTRELGEHSKEMTSLKQQLVQQQEQKTELERKNTQLTAELQKLHSESRLSQDENRTFEGRLAELNAQLARSQLWGQHQLATLQSREEELVLLKVEMATLRESYHTKVAQVETLNTQMDSTEQKYRMAVSEVEILRQALGDARSDSSRLQRESELVVTNVNQWVREQKQSNEKLGLKIKDQHKKIIHLTAEKDHLQESVEKLQAEIRRLKTELDEQRMETEGCKAIQAQRLSDQRSTSLLLQTHQHSALSGVFSHQREKLNRKKPLAVRLDLS